MDDSRKADIARTSEAALIAILTVNGGFPGAPGDEVGRAIVREVREMYSEIDKPTLPKPKPTDSVDAESTSPYDSFDVDDDEYDQEEDIV